MKKAFTLIELLVVIAIIAILAAILFPVFAQAKAAAKKTQGLAQMKQVGTAAQLYLGDSDDTYPVVNRTYVPSGWGIQTAFQLPSWLAHLQPYTKNTQMLYGPSARYNQVTDNGSNINLMLPGFTGSWNNNHPNPPGTLRIPTRSLGANEFIVHRLNATLPEVSTQTPIAVNASSIAQSSSTPFIADCTTVLFNGTDRIMASNFDKAFWMVTNEITTATNPDSLNVTYSRYTGGSVVIMADTSAKWRKQNSMGLDRTRNTALPAKLRWQLPLDPIEDDRLQ